MKIAILSDLHGNIYALEQVLIKAKSEHVEKLLILGDIVGYYYRPDEILKLLSEWDYVFIRGNHEDILASIISGTADELSIKAKYGSAHYKALKELTSQQIDFLINSPTQLYVPINSLNILLCHGAPWDHNFYLYPDTKSEILEKSQIDGVDFVFVGHSHYAFEYVGDKTRLVNVGSVGQSRKCGGKAQWVLFDTDSSAVDFMSTKYDVTSLIKEVEAVDPNNAYLRNILLRKDEI